MLSISHATLGAYIAVSIPNPLVSIPLILASHYAADAVHHWDVGTGLTKGTKSKYAALKQEVPDLILAGIIVLIFFPLSSSAWTSIPEFIQSPQVWGAFVALIPDFLEAPKNFFKEPRFLKPLNYFHNSFHHSIPRILDGITPQIILLVLIWLIR